MLMVSVPPHIPLEDVAAYPLPGMTHPVSLSFSPDDRLITFLYSEAGSLVRQLYQFDPRTGKRSLGAFTPGEGVSEDNLSPEERLRRERQRTLALGVTSYQWADQADRLLLPLPDGLYLQEGAGAPLRKLVGSEAGAVIDPQFSPDGNWVAYVQQDELNVVAVEGGLPMQITSGARECGWTHGLAEYIAQEEMGRSHGFWWSPDGEYLAFEQVDETHIPVYRILHQGKRITGEGAQEDHRYPFAGRANARLRLGVVSRKGGEVVWLDLGKEEDIYLARVDWFSDGSLAVQVENRSQTRLDLLRYDIHTGKGNLLLCETSEVWVNLHDHFKALKKGEYAGCFIWASERTGFCHLYLYDAGGKLVRALTGGDWLVDALCGVDEENGMVYFTGTKDSPLECHLYTVSLAGEEIRRITQETGNHAVVLDHGFQHFIDTHDSLGQPPSVCLRSLRDGSLICTIFDPSDPRLERLQLEPPELVTLTSQDGETLYGAVYKPPAEFGPGPHPGLVYVYGGPHAQMVKHSWAMTVSMRAQSMRRLGFLVFVLDNRGGARRGLAFEAGIKNNMGDLEVRDQVDGVRWLVQQGLVDPQRVGVYGWSYGGYMALMCLARAPETFKAAVAGAPVTAWDGYDTHYTERYMGTPQANPEGYLRSSVMAHVSNLSGRLMLVHGLIDENVHFRHTARLLNALIEARKTYDLLLFPDERHSPRRLADRVFMEERIRDFFLRALAGKPE
jgi:dipeptidyl-peptidase 4